MTPEQLLEILKTNANARKRRNLEIIHDVCREQFERGSKDFSQGQIGRLSKEKGGPATQSIRNKTGDDFKALIAAWAEFAGGSARRQYAQPTDPKDALLSKIPDPAVRAVVGRYLAEHRSLTGEVNLLKKNAEVIIDRRPVAATPIRPSDVIQILPSFRGLSLAEIDALKHAASEKLLEDEGWRRDPSGRIVSQHGRTIFKAGFASAIEKVLQAIEGEKCI